MKYIANPVIVDAWKIIQVFPRADSHGNNFQILRLENDNLVQADAGMLARINPVIGDYWVVQEDGYIYLNPKEVFERKYRPHVKEESK